MKMKLVAGVACVFAVVVKTAAAACAGMGLGFVDPMVGTEGRGSEYGGMMPMTGVPFGAMHLVPVTRTNAVGRTSFNALDKNLLGFCLTRQPAIWMGEFGPVRIWLDKPLAIESIEAHPWQTTVKAGGKTYEQNEGQPADSDSFEVKQQIDIRHDKNAGAQVVEMTAKKISCPPADPAFQPERIDEVEQEYSDDDVSVSRNSAKDRIKEFSDFFRSSFEF